MTIDSAKIVAEIGENTNRVLRIKEVMSRTGLSRGGIYARMGRDEFPRSIGLGGRAVGWLESEIDQWIQARIAESRSEVEA